jgi:hypothetical protein
MVLRFNAKRLIEDCGGVAAFAKLLGRTRTTPYRAIRTGYMGTPVLAKVLELNPNMNINDYFEEVADGKSDVEEQ